MKQEAPQIAIVDDDAAVLKSLSALLMAHGYRTETFRSGEEFSLQDGEHKADCLLLDLRMPGMSGLELQAALKHKGVDLPIVFITAHGDIPMAVQAMRQGAVEFIEKPFTDERLLQAIELALAPDPSQEERRRGCVAAAERLAALTTREREVFEHLAMGETSKAIARILNISQRTVEVHRGSVKSKLGTQSLSDLIRIKRTLADG
ncbi:MAG: response regulator transcription factor [Rhizobiales bacterium]|nr:response regulator transcription factor [Hyphomicrobiales bacterium]